MKKLCIKGGGCLCGEVGISGFKNAALPILYATVLTADVSLIENLPKIRDVLLTLEILKAMGAIVVFADEHTVLIDTRPVLPCRSPDGAVSSLRASSYLLGAELARFGKTRAAIPGGCRIGARPLDLHVLAFSALGADVTAGHGAMAAEAESLLGGRISFPTPSVGATVNAILAATAADGETVIEVAAREPHVVDLCAYLAACGAEIEGAGSEQIRIRGGRHLHGARHRIMPDMIEAGTYLAAVGAAGGEIYLKDAVAAHLSSALLPARAMGIGIAEDAGGLFVSRTGELAPFSLTAEPYPGFPTDLHPQFAALATQASGNSTLDDRVFPERFGYVDELRRMGGLLERTEGGVAVSGSSLKGTKVRAVDLRAGAAEVVAALAAKGTTVILDADILERGYEGLADKLCALGATAEVK